MGLKGQSWGSASLAERSVCAGNLAARAGIHGTEPGAGSRRIRKKSGGGGNRTPTDSESTFANPRNKPRSGVDTGAEALTPPIHAPSTDHPKTIPGPTRSAPGVPEDPALAVVIAVWPALSLEDRQRILAIAKRSGVPLKFTDLQDPPEGAGGTKEG